MERLDDTPIGIAVTPKAIPVHFPWQLVYLRQCSSPISVANTIQYFDDDWEFQRQLFAAGSGVNFINRLFGMVASRIRQPLVIDKIASCVQHKNFHFSFPLCPLLRIDLLFIDERDKPAINSLSELPGSICEVQLRPQDLCVLHWLPTLHCSSVGVFVYQPLRRSSLTCANYWGTLQPPVDVYVDAQP